MWPSDNFWILIFQKFWKVIRNLWKIVKNVVNKVSLIVSSDYKQNNTWLLVISPRVQLNTSLVGCAQM